MFTEIRGARQEPGGFRRIFVDEEMDLYLWYDHRGGPLVGFQLCYDKGAAQRAVTWTQARGYDHHVVDHDRSPEGGHKAVATLVEDRSFEPEIVAVAFRRAAGLVEGRAPRRGGPYRGEGDLRLDQATAELVFERLLAFEGHPEPAADRASNRGRGRSWFHFGIQKSPEPRAPSSDCEPPPRLEPRLEPSPLEGLALVCTRHPSLPGAYPVKLVLEGGRLLVLASSWLSLRPKKAAALDLRSLESFLPRARLEALDLTALEQEGSFEIAPSRVRHIAFDHTGASATLEYLDDVGLDRTCRLASQRDGRRLEALVKGALGEERSTWLLRKLQAPRQAEPHRVMIHCEEPRREETREESSMLPPPGHLCLMIDFTNFVCERCWARYRSELEALGFEEKLFRPDLRYPFSCSRCGRIEELPAIGKKLG